MNVLRKDLQRMAAAAEAAFRPTDPWRPKIHLAPPVGWLNDPNDLIDNTFVKYVEEFNKLYPNIKISQPAPCESTWDRTSFFSSAPSRRWTRCFMR